MGVFGLPRSHLRVTERGLELKVLVNMKDENYSQERRRSAKGGRFSAHNRQIAQAQPDGVGNPTTRSVAY